jgi:shikimate dehydrogenase
MIRIDGSTRIIGITGDPIAQVKAPTTLNPMLAERGLNAVLVPFHVSPADLDTFMAGLKAIKNLDALVVTVPHKAAVLRHVDRPSPRVRQVGSANLLLAAQAALMADFLTAHMPRPR